VPADAKMNTPPDIQQPFAAAQGSVTGCRPSQAGRG
jgi:hypothetical protein